MGSDPTARLAEVVERHRGELIAVKGVVGVAEGECGGRPCIRVFVARQGRQILKRIPKTLEGFSVVVDVTGGFKALK